MIGYEGKFLFFLWIDVECCVKWNVVFDDLWDFIFVFWFSLRVYFVNMCVKGVIVVIWIIGEIECIFVRLLVWVGWIVY